jgi:hypothetical protein
MHGALPYGRPQDQKIEEVPTAACAVPESVNILDTVWLAEHHPRLWSALSCGTYLVEYSLGKTAVNISKSAFLDGSPSC